MAAVPYRLGARFSIHGARGSRLAAVKTSLIVVGCVLVYCESIGLVWHYTIDDAAISYAYAKHWLDGHGLVAVVGGPRIEGYSNPLWVALLAVAGALGWALPAAGKVLGVVLGGIALLLGIRIVQQVEGRRALDLRWHDAGPVLVASLLPPFSVWMPQR